MQRWRASLVMILAMILALPAAAAVLAQQPQTPPAAPPAAQTTPNPSDAPLPDPRALLLDVERNDRRLEAMRKDYTYHVRLEEQELNKDGSVKKTAVTDSESVSIDGVRVDRVVARNGKPLSPDDQQKESARIDKEVAKARDRRAKAASKGEETDDRGDTILTAARILELGRFSNERRVQWNGRPTIVLDYAGDPNAKTHSAMEGIVRDLVGTVWIDEADHVLVRGEGHFLNDFKIGGGLLADVRKGSSFQFETVHAGEGVWLPATINGQGSMRLLLFAGFNGRLHLATSDYRKFRTSAVILPGQRPVDANGNPLPATATPTPQIPAEHEPSPPGNKP